jgi:nucleotide-binding universal stress UspA family protein
VVLRNLLVPVADNPESERAMDVASRLADRGAAIAVLHVIEIPPFLPLAAHMLDEERAAHQLLERMASVADRYGVKVVPRMLQDRSAGEAIVGFAARRDVELIVIGAPRKPHAPFGSTVEHVLRKADSRVMLIAAAPVQKSVDAVASVIAAA